MDNYFKSIFPCRGKKNPRTLSTISETSKRETDRWHKDIISKLLKKDEIIENNKREIQKLIDKKNVLENKVKSKNEVIYILNDKIILLTRELGIVKTDYLKALEEIKTLKNEAHNSARKSELLRLKKEDFDTMKKKLIEAEKLLVQEKFKTNCLETLKVNIHPWRELKHSDPHCFDLLMKTNNLQKQVREKLDIIHAKDSKIKKTSMQVKELTNMVKRRPFCYMDEPEEHMLEYYKTIQRQNGKIKALSGQVNMYETLLSERLTKCKTKNK